MTIWEMIRDAKRRRAIKRQLRCAGINIPDAIMYDIRALRELRRCALL